MLVSTTPSSLPTSGPECRVRSQRVFSGRVIFDHLPKTAGMAVNSWLQTALGSGCASPNLISDHRTLIARYGGTYSVLTAHVGFHDPGLDPRYRYVTLLREPIDRLVSWLYFVVTNHDGNQLGDIWHAARRFLADECTDTRHLPLANPYVRHFAAIEGGWYDSDDSALAAALAAVEQYDVWGLYESMPDFLEDFAGLLGVAPPAKLDHVNATRQRPTMQDLDRRLRTRLTALNALDMEFYAILKGRHAAARRHRTRTSTTVGGWEPLPSPQPRGRTRPGFRLHSAGVTGGPVHAPGSLLEFDVAFALAAPVEDLEIGFVIRDAVDGEVFTTNTTLLNRPISPAAAGAHQVRCTLLAGLPDGDYTVGFRFRENPRGPSRELAIFDRAAVFRIGATDCTPGAAPLHLPATIQCVAVDDARMTRGWRLEATDPRLLSEVGKTEGRSVASDSRAGFLLFGPYTTVHAGGWRAVVDGAFEPGAGCVRIDVVSGTGQVVHAALELTNPAERVDLDFQLDQTVTDLEIRVWVHESAAARIDAIAMEVASATGAVHRAPHQGLATDSSRTGGRDDGFHESRTAPVREAEAAADSAAAEATTPAGRAPDSDERTVGAAARGHAALGDPARAGATEGLDERVLDPAAGPHHSSFRPGGRTGALGPHDARDASVPCPDGGLPESRLRHPGEPSFSIVIATDGRAAALAELLESLQFLEGPAFEVCVVRGPTEDGISHVLDAWQDRLKTACNPIRNLSLSRNIGIAMAAGEVVAFLDDDAIPDTDWLVDIAQAFADPAVACAGGMNRDRSGAGLQYGYATANRMGQARWDRSRPADDLCVPGAAEFPYTQGTNTAIRRDDLEALGGFDEEYEFYLDETDLCCRLVDAGRLVRQLPRAIVHHRSLPSSIRTADGVTHSLYSVLKNKLYFSLVNNLGHHTVAEALSDYDRFVTIQEQHLQRMVATAAEGPRWLEQFAHDALRGRATGLARGSLRRRRLMSPELIDRYRRPFLPLPRRPVAERLHCTLHWGKALAGDTPRAGQPAARRMADAAPPRARVA